MAETINGVPIGDLPGIESVPDDSMLVVEFLGKAYHMPGAVLRQMIQDVLDSMGDSVDDVTEARLTAAIETVLSSGKYNGVSPSVEVLDEEDGTSVIHVIDAFGDKRYPVEVKGATDAVQYVKQELTSGQQAIARTNIGAAAYKSREVYVVNISGNYKDGFKAVFGSTLSSAGPLTAMAAYGHVVVGVATEDLVFPYLFDMSEMYDWPDKEYTLPAGTAFNYNDGRFFATYNTGLHRELENKIFTISGSTSGLVWSGEVEAAQYFFHLINPYNNDLACSFEYDGIGIPMDGLNALVYDAVNNNKPIFCYQKDAVFKLDDGSTYQPPVGVPFYYDKDAAVFRCEIDGYECAAYVLLYGFKLTAKKTTPYKTAESKADDLKAEDGTLFLLSAGEPIGAGVPLPTGSADDSKIFIADLNTSTYEDIKAADDAGKICYALWGGYTACMLTTLSPESAIFTTLLDPHLGLYVKFTKGTVGVSDFGLTESHSVLYEPQSLTDAQKAQARENIGALSADDIDVDSIGSNVFVADYDTTTFAEIKAAHDAGKVCFVKSDGMPFCQLLGIDDSEAIFIREINDTTDYKVTFTSAGEKDFTLVDKNISDVYVVSLFSAKYAEVKAAYEAGKACFVTYGALLCPLTVLDEEKAEFVGMLTPHLGIKGTVPAEGNPDFTYVHSNAVQTVEQSLTDAQKAQARKNIGAGEPVVDTVTSQLRKEFAVGYSEEEISNVTEWQTATSPSGFNARQRSCCYGNGYYVIAGTSGQMAYRTKETAWVKPAAFTSGVITGLAYGNGRFIAVDSNGGVFTAATPDATWEQVFTASGVIESVRYLNNRFVAVGDNGFFATSLDGKEWTQKTTFTTNTLIDSAYGDGWFIAVGASGSIFRSINLNDWLDVSIADFGDIRTALFTVNGFVIGGAGGKIAYSTDGKSWSMATNNTTSTVNWIRGFAYAEKRIYAVMYISTGGGEIWVSKDGGATWAVDRSVSGRLWCVAHGDGVFFTSGDGGAIYEMDLGIKWQNEEPDENAWYRFVATLSNGERIVSESYKSKGEKQKAVLYEAQELTDVQKAQARTNIGALGTGGGTLSGGLDFSNINSWITPYLLAFKNDDPNANPVYPYTGFYQWGDEWQVNARDASNNWVKNLLSINNITGIANFAAVPTVNGAQLALLSDISGANVDLSGYAKLQTPNDLVHAGNEITMVPGGYSGPLYLNYRTASNNQDGNITEYLFCNGKGGTAGVTLSADSFSGTAARATADGNGRNIVSTYATKDEVVTAANGSLKVTLSGTSVDKTLAQIETALNAGRHVYMAENDGQVFQLSMHIAGMMACFTSVVTSGTQVTVKTVIVYDGIEPSVFKKTL